MKHIEKMSQDTSESTRLHAFFANCPEEAHHQFFEGSKGINRRGFFVGAGIATTAGLLGMAIPFYRNLPRGLVPVAFATEDTLIGKDGLVILNEHPLNAETPAHLLDDATTPNSRHFIRNNGLPPKAPDSMTWTLTVDGMVQNPSTFTIADLRAHFEVVTMALTIECGGNGRAFFDPPAPGEQWTLGAVACSQWTGVRLDDVLRTVGIKPGAVYTAHYSADRHISEEPSGQPPISRGMPIAKAMTDNVLIAFRMNDAPLPMQHGAPLRLVVPGWPGSCSQKWLTRIHLRDQVHDGPKMTGTSYRIPRYPVAPGDSVPESHFQIIERMPVKSLITFPANASSTGREIEVRGHAWSGDRTVRSVDLSIDFGASWIPARLNPPVNSGAWQEWRCTLSFPEAGYYEVWARATDSSGEMQPFAVNWNPRGYVNNTMHRIALQVA